MVCLVRLIDKRLNNPHSLQITRTGTTTKPGSDRNLTLLSSSQSCSIDPFLLVLISSSVQLFGFVCLLACVYIASLIDLLTHHSSSAAVDLCVCVCFNLGVLEVLID